MPGPEVHFRLTMQWAIEEGLNAADAEAVGRASLLVDEYWPGGRKPLRHFNPTASVLVAPLELRRAIALERAGEHREAIVHLGYSLHSRQDAIGHGRFGFSHLRHRWGWMERHPDVWEQMPPGIRTRIERATRSALRRFIDASLGAGAGQA